MPEGLKTHAVIVAEELEKLTGASCIILADPCFGACDIPTNIEDIADVLVQFGHSEIPSMNCSSSVLFVEVFFDIDVIPMLQKILPELSPNIGLVTTVQHIRMLPGIRSWLEMNGIHVEIGQGDDRIKYAGQLLGCNVSAASSVKENVDQYIYIGSGDFHPLSVAITTSKPVTIIDPYVGDIRNMDALPDRILRQRHAAITRASNAQRFLILVSRKPGQMRLELAVKLRDMILKSGKHAEIVSMDEIRF